MTVVILGTGPRVAWLEEVLGRLKAQAGRGAEPPIVVSKFSRDAFEALSAKTIETLILVDHVPDVAAFSQEAKPALCDTIRPQAMRFAFAFELAIRAGRTVALSSANAPLSWLEALADIAGVSTEDVLRASSNCPVPSPAEEVEWPAGPLGAVARDYLVPLGNGLSRESRVQVTWPRELFLDGDAPGMPLPPTIEVGGRARILAYGPYLPLPMGPWSATAYLGFSPDIGRLPFIFEIEAGGRISRGFFEVEKGGLFSLVLDFEVAQPLHLVEVRLISQDSALEGQTALIEVRLDRVIPADEAH